jgi:hypothetical protein
LPNKTAAQSYHRCDDAEHVHRVLEEPAAELERSQEQL